MKILFSQVSKTLVKNSLDPSLKPILTAYHCNFLEKRGVNVSNFLDEINSHEEDLNYLAGFLSVLEIAHYLVSKKHPIEFPRHIQQQGVKDPDLICWVRRKRITIDVKCRGVQNTLKLGRAFAEDIHSGKVPSWEKSVDQAVSDEILKSKLMERVLKGLQQADMVIFDESFNIDGIGARFFANSISPKSHYQNSFHIEKNNVVFFQHNNGNFQFLEVRLRRTLASSM